MSAAPEESIVVRTLRVPRAQRSFLHWVLEAHEGLVTLTEPAAAEGALVLLAPRAQAADLDALLAGIAREIPVVFLTP